MQNASVGAAAATHAAGSGCALLVVARLTVHQLLKISWLCVKVGALLRMSLLLLGHAAVAGLSPAPAPAAAAAAPTPAAPEAMEVDAEPSRKRRRVPAPEAETVAVAAVAATTAATATPGAGGGGGSGSGGASPPFSNERRVEVRRRGTPGAGGSGSGAAASPATAAVAAAAGGQPSLPPNLSKMTVQVRPWFWRRTGAGPWQGSVESQWVGLPVRGCCVDDLQRL